MCVAYVSPARSIWLKCLMGHVVIFAFGRTHAKDIRPWRGRKREEQGGGREGMQIRPENEKKRPRADDPIFECQTSTNSLTLSRMTSLHVG